MHRILALLAGALLACSPAAPTTSGSTSSTSTTAAVVNQQAVAATVYAAFGADSAVKAADWPFCKNTSPLNCTFSLAGGASQPLPTGGRYLNVTLAFNGPVGCGTTKAELNLNNPAWYDTVDVSLVDGFNERVQAVINGTVLGPPLGATGNEAVLGLYPFGCDICVARQNPPCGIPKGTDGCKSGTQSNPVVPCQVQGATKGGGGAVVVALLPR